MQIRSLKSQIILSVLLAEALCGAAFTGAALIHEWNVRVHALDTTLRGRADSLLGAIQDAEDPNDNVLVDPTELDVPKADVYAVYTQDGRLLGSSLAAPAVLIARDQEGISTRRVGDKPYRVLQRKGIRVIDRAESGGVGLRRPVTILYAVRSGQIWHEVREDIGFYVGIDVLIILLTAVIIIALLRRMLIPLQELAAEAATLSLRSLTFAAPESALQIQELRPLAETLSVTVSGLRSSFEQQTRFMGDAAHELKTAVAVVRSSTQLLLLRSRDPDEYIAGLQAIFIDNTRVEDLVARMLISARFEEQASTKQENLSAVADPSAAIERVLTRLQPYTESHETPIIASPVAGLRVRIVQDELDVLLSNLIVNAVQHSSRGKEIQLSVIEQPGLAVIQVKDEGDGISQSALPHVFERFYREDRSRSRDTGGAGLGLAICKSIVEAAAGEIAIESEQHAGTVVTVRLPLAI